MSYYRRYTLSSLLGLQATDDDGNGLKAKEKLTDDRFNSALTALKENKITKATILAFDLTETQKEQLNK